MFFEHFAGCGGGAVGPEKAHVVNFDFYYQFIFKFILVFFKSP